MSFSTSLQTDFSQIMNYGVSCKIKYYTQSWGGAGSGYDDDVSLTQSGADVWASGIILPLDKGSDKFLVEQGRLLSDDSRLYFNGSIDTSKIFKVMVGSPTGNVYASIENGVKIYSLQDNDVYKKLYIRILTNGSLLGE